MKHPTEEQLILYHYREGEDCPAVKEHLESCATCRDSYQRLQRLLSAVGAMPVPECAAGYPAEVWQRLRPRLEQRPEPFWRSLLLAWPLPTLPRGAFAPAMVVLLLAAFLVGRSWPRPAPVDTAQLRAGLADAVKAELRQEFDAKLAAARGELRADLAEMARTQPDLEAVATVATVTSRAELQRLWTVFLEGDRQARAAERADLLALRQDLETFAILADNDQEQTQQQLGQLAASVQSAAFRPESDGQPPNEP